MTKHVKYECNLCRGIRDVEDLWGVHFENQTWRRGDVRSCNTHLCTKCVNRIKELSREE